MSEIKILLQQYEQGPASLRSVVNRVDSSLLDETPVPGKWSIRQVVCHIADFEPVYVERIKRVLAEENPEIAGANPDAFADHLCYDYRDIDEELNLIEVTRRHLLGILNHCDVEVFQRTGVHSEDGPLTLETLLERISSHIPHHLQFIEEKIAALR